MRGLIKKIIEKLKCLGSRPPKFFDNQLYWAGRAKKFGKRSVINIAHPGSKFEEITARDKNQIFPFLTSLLRGDEEVILDFGCGVGRFTAGLASLIHGKAIGVDITAELIRLAPENDHVEYHVLREGRIPLRDHSVDVLWAYGVFGCIKRKFLDQTSREVDRVLKKNGLLFFTENTTEKSNMEYYAYYQVKDYQKIFPFIELKHLHDYFDIGKSFTERFSIMAGRRSPDAVQE